MVVGPLYVADNSLRVSNRLPHCIWGNEERHYVLTGNMLAIHSSFMALAGDEMGLSLVLEQPLSSIAHTFPPVAGAELLLLRLGKFSGHPFSQCCCSLSLFFFSLFLSLSGMWHPKTSGRPRGPSCFLFLTDLSVQQLS